MASSLLDILEALHRDAVRVKREQRERARLGPHGGHDWARRRRKAGYHVPQEHAGLAEYHLALGTGCSHDSHLVAEYGSAAGRA